MILAQMLRDGEPAINGADMATAALARWAAVMAREAAVTAGATTGAAGNLAAPGATIPPELTVFS